MIVITIYICTLSICNNTDDFDPLNPVLIVRKESIFPLVKIIMQEKFREVQRLGKIHLFAHRGRGNTS